MVTLLDWIALNLLESKRSAVYEKLYKCKSAYEVSRYD